MQLLTLEWTSSVLPPAAVAAALVLTFLFGEHYSERKKRRELRRHWKAGESAAGAASPPNQPEAAAPVWNLAASLEADIAMDRATEQALDPARHHLLRHLSKYGLVVLAVCAMLVARVWLEPQLQGRLVYVFFLVPVMLAAWAGGVPETLLALVLGFLAAEWFIAEPHSSFLISSTHGWIGALLYFLPGLGILWFMQSERTARLRAFDSDIRQLKRLAELERERTAHQHTRLLRQLLAGVVNALPEPIFCLTAQGQFAAWNPAAERLFGFGAQEILGQPLALLLPPPQPAEQPRLVERISRGERIENLTLPLLRKDGSRLQGSLAVSLVKDASGKALGACVRVQEALSPERIPSSPRQ